MSRIPTNRVLSIDEDCLITVESVDEILFTFDIQSARSFSIRHETFMYSFTTDRNDNSVRVTANKDNNDIEPVMIVNGYAAVTEHGVRALMLEEARDRFSLVEGEHRHLYRLVPKDADIVVTDLPLQSVEPDLAPGALEVLMKQT